MADLFTRPEAKEELDLGKQTLVGVEPHTKQIKTRLKFLYYILKHSTLTLPLDHLNTLWDCVIGNGLTPKEKDLGTRLCRHARMHTQHRTVLTLVAQA